MFPRRQSPLALSDVERTQTCEFAGESPLPVQNFLATLRVTPVVDGEALSPNDGRRLIASQIGEQSELLFFAMRLRCGLNR